MVTDSSWNGIGIDVWLTFFPFDPANILQNVIIFYSPMPEKIVSNSIPLSTLRIWQQTHSYIGKIPADISTIDNATVFCHPS